MDEGGVTTNLTTEHTSLTVATLNIFYGLTCVIITILGSFGNAIIFNHFYTKQDKTTNTLIYMMINSTDFLICIMVLPIGLSNFTNGKEVFFSTQFTVNLWGYMWNVLCRMSVFLIGMLSICRTLVLVFPFLKVHRSVVMPIIASYIFFMCLQSSIPFWYKVQYMYLKGGRFCAWHLEAIPIFADTRGTPYRLAWFIFIILEFVLPVPIVFGSCVISTYYLMFKNQRMKKSRSMKIKRAATCTIIMLTVAYLFFNIPFCGYFFLSYIYTWKNAQVNINIHLVHFFLIHTVGFNSFFNTVIYVFRMKAIKDNIAEKSTQIYNTMRRSSSKHQTTKRSDNKTTNS